MAGLAVAAGLLVALPKTGLSATAAHDPWKVQEVRTGTPIADAFGRCEACHSMDTTAGEPGTSYISNTARTIQWIKSYKTPPGPFAPADNLACTFCHSTMLDNTVMEDALNEFTSPTIKHPVGRKVDGTTDTNNEWLSKIDSAPLADELQCIECHSTALVTYPYHEGATTDPAGWTGTWNKTINKYALQNVVAAGDADKKHCVDTCHGDLVALGLGVNSDTKPKMGHYIYGNFNGTTIYDPSGQAMQLAGSTCVICHDTHTSTKAGLIQDAIKRGSTDTVRTAIDEGNCVAVCHAPGAFSTHGHGGKVGINVTTCAPCHTTAVRHRDQTDDATRRRLTYADPVKSNLQTNRSANGLDDDMDGLKDAADLDEATFAYSKTSNCQTCHINYAGHGSGTRDAACLDCHDMHGDDAAINNNAAMIRSTIFGESTVFTAADRAAGIRFRTATANGVCDNDACHSNISGALGTVHLGGPIDDATDCTGCHSFAHPTDPAQPVASFKAVMNCNGCHSYPPITGDTVQTGIVKVVDHTIRSRDGVAGTSSNAAFLTAHNGCTLCHGTSGNATLDGFANTETGGGGKDAYAGHRNASVELNGISVPDNNVNANYSATNGQCAKACHSPGWAVGYATLPQTVYATGNAINLQEYGSGACNSCHGGGNNASVAANLWPDGQAAVTLKNEDRESTALRHQKHMEKLSAQLFSETIAVLLTDTGNGTTDTKQKKLCAYCHPDPNDSAFDPGGATSSFNDVHNNGTVNVGGAYGHRLWDVYATSFATTDSWTYTAGTPSTSWDGSCATVDCHDNKTTDTTAAGATTGYGWYDVTLTACVMCHDDISNTGNATGLTHERHRTTTSYAGGGIACGSCHTGSPAWPTTPPSAGHIDGALSVPGVSPTTFTYAVGTGCGTNNCHNAGYTVAAVLQAPVTASYPWGVDIGGALSCTECHNATAATQATYSHDEHLTPAGTWGRTIGCGDCHAAATAATHVNQTVTFNGTYITDAQYLGDKPISGTTFGTCGTNNCHRADTTGTAPYNGGAGSYTWNTALTNNCDQCHRGTAIASSKHQAHLLSNALGPGSASLTECIACHATTTDASGNANQSAHLDFAATLSFQATYNYEALTAGRAAGAAATTTCNNVKCHNGVTTPVWNGTVACGSCHSTSGTGPLPSAASVLGKHAQHADNDADYTDCEHCHANATLYTATGGQTAHMNLAADVSMTGITYAEVTGGGGVNYSATDYTDNGTCTSTTGCHGSATLTGGWATGAPLANGCFACHDGTDTTAGATKPAVNTTTPNLVNSTQYNGQGHGQTVAFPGSGTAGPGYTYDSVPGCYNCHDSNAAHAPDAGTTDPFRLGAYATNTDGLCTQGAGCHDPALIKTHSLAIVGGSATWPNGYAFKCVDCHDPHGDASYYMVRSHISAPLTTGDPSFGSDSYGTPQDTANASAITFTDLTGNLANSYGVDGLTNGICEVCHVDTTNVQFYLRDGGANTHNVSLRCTGCHTHDKGFKGSCTDCHGSDTGENWPDGIANNPTRSAYADDAGAHDAHITAIGAAVPAAAGNGSCAYCHPGNPPTGHEMDSTSGASQAEVTRMTTNASYSGPPTVGDYWAYLEGATASSGTPVYFKALAGGDDTNAYYDMDTDRCENVDCHGGGQTPAWYPDTTAPTWSGGVSNIQATDQAVGGVLSVTWDTATDPSTPVSYVLYRSTVAANVYASPDAMWTVGTNSYTDSGLSNGTTYYYGVRAMDDAGNTTTDTNTSTGRAPSGSVPGPSTTDYYLTKNTGTFLWTGTSTSSNACSTIWSVTMTNSTTFPPNGRGALLTAKSCATASTNNRIRPNATSNGIYRNLVAFYKNTTSSLPMNVTGDALSNSFGFRVSSTTQDVQIYLAAVDSAGVHSPSTNNVQLTDLASSAMTQYAPDMSGLSVALPAGSRLAVLFRWSDATNSASGHTNDQMSVDNYDATMLNRIRLTEVPADSTAPSWTGGVSGLAVANPGTGGELSVSWNSATDSITPILYRLYRSAEPDTNPLDNAYTTYGTTSITDTGLIDGTTYYYHVKAIDGLANATTNSDVQSGRPTTVPPGATCTTCHGTPPTSAAHGKHATSDEDYTDCDRCHGNATYQVSGVGGYTTSGPSVVHNNGSVDMYFARIPDADATFANVAAPNDICSNVDCHMSAPTPSWTTGSTTCTSCHQMPPITQAGVVDHDATVGMVFADFLTAHDECKACHGKNSTSQHANYAAGSHGDGSVRMNGPDATPGPAAGTEYDDSVGGCDYACHLNDANHQLPTSTTRGVNYGDFGLGACSFCHETGAYSAPAVPAAGLHAGSCDQCHPLHKVKDATKQVLIPNNTGVGINYATHTGIFLGGTGTKSTGWATANTPTEAEICWGCHDGLGISEWGVNNNAQTGSIAYNYGSLSTSNWRTATWTSGTALFGYKTAAILSTHAATTGAGTAKGIDTLDTIRCSYCHDVHDRDQALGDTTSGQPYLRGSWRGNPYPEDGAPQTASVYPAANSTTNPWGPVPRGGAANGTATGGFFIDQNSGNPVITNAWNATQFGGLCDLCHGTTKDGVFVAAEIDALNQYDAAGVGWVSALNGHSNSVEGGTDSTAAARNIFAGRGGATNQDTMNTADHPFMNFSGTVPGLLPGDAGGGGFRGTGSGWTLLPAMTDDPGDGKGWDDTQWNNLTTPAARNLDKTGATVNSNYHTFSCSKCHNPHASRLPALMITNCLDTKHNAWDNDFNNPDHGTTDTVNAGRSVSNWSSAQNCHRLGGNDPSDANDTAANTATTGNKGWNTVTPW